MSRRRWGERGDWTFGPIIGLIIIAFAIVGFFAVCTGPDDDDDIDTLGRIELVSHEYGYEDCEYEECGYGYRYDRRRERRGRGGDYDGNRAGISPGPFDRSPVDFSNSCISLDCSGFDRRRDGDESEDRP